MTSARRSTKRNAEKYLLPFSCLLILRFFSCLRSELPFAFDHQQQTRQMVILRNDLGRLLSIAVLLMGAGHPASPVQAQTDPLNEAWRWVHYGAESGLPSDRVLDIVETTEGIAWAMTGAGLAWYDEYRWHPDRQ